MKKTIVCSLLGALLLPMSSFAFQSQVGETLNITTTNNEDLYVAGGNVTINTPISKDLSVAGGQIYINSRISEDLLIAGGDIAIEGSLGESAKIAGGKIRINSDIKKELLVGGGEVTIGSNASVQGHTLIGAGTLKIDGTLNDATLYAGVLILQGTIRGNANINVETIQILPGAKILGNLTYRSAQKNIELEKIVVGQITFEQLPVKTAMQAFISALVGYLAFGFLFLVVFGIIFFYIGTAWFTKPIKQFKEGPWSSLGYGFLVYAAVPFAILLLMISMIGIPFALLLIGVYICLFVFYKLLNVVFYAHLLVDRMGGVKKVKKRKQISIVVLCALVSSLIASIDIILSFFVLGAIIKACCGTSKK